MQLLSPSARKLLPRGSDDKSEMRPTMIGKESQYLWPSRSKKRRYDHVCGRTHSIKEDPFPRIFRSQFFRWVRSNYFQTHISENRKYRSASRRCRRDSANTALSSLPCWRWHSSLRQFDPHRRSILALLAPGFAELHVAEAH